MIDWHFLGIQPWEMDGLAVHLCLVHGLGYGWIWNCKMEQSKLNGGYDLQIRGNEISSMIKSNHKSQKSLQVAHHDYPLLSMITVGLLSFAHHCRLF